MSLLMRSSTGALLILYGLLLAGLYHSTLAWLITHDWEKADYSYCYLIPFVVLYLVWEKREALARLPASPSWFAMAPLAAGIALFWLGELGGEFFTLYVSFWLLLAGLCWLHLGWRKLRVISFPLLFSLTMFPLPDFLYANITLRLKLISSTLGVEMIQNFGLPAFREGNIIDLGFTQLQVIDACSGLRFLTSLIVMAILLAYFMKASFWKKAFLVLLTIPLAILVNSLRIASVGILYKYWGQAAAEGFFHDFSGWVIFMFSLALLLAVMWILNRIGPKWKPREKESGEVARPGPEIACAQIRKGSASMAGFPHFLVAAILLGVTLVLSQSVEFREKIPIKKSFDHFPLQVGEWQGARRSMEQQFIDSLDFSDYVIIDYSDEKGRNINLYVAYYESQRKGRSIHSPATCLPGSGWVFSQAGSAAIPVATGDGQPMRVNRAFMQKDDARQLAYYWFSQRGRILTNAYQLKLYTFWDALTRQRTDGALVRVITPLAPNEEPAEAEGRMVEFIRLLVPVLEEYIPGETK